MATCASEDPKDKRRSKHYSYDENVNEPGKLVEDEAVEIEQDIPSEDRQSVETIEKDDAPDPAVFEE